MEWIRKLSKGRNAEQSIFPQPWAAVKPCRTTQSMEWNVWDLNYSKEHPQHRDDLSHQLLSITYVLLLETHIFIISYELNILIFKVI